MINLSSRLSLMHGTLQTCKFLFTGSLRCRLRLALYSQVLVDLGPSYFRYMDSTATKPSILAKLLGFYTIEIRNLESGATQARADLLIMENLFYGQKISKTFDLKGIQGRKVKASNTTSKTLFDGEWIEGTLYVGNDYTALS